MIKYDDRFKDNPIMNDDTIGRPFTPGNWAGSEKNIEPISIIRMTCGGGMGGAQWRLYTKRIAYTDFTCSDSKFLKVTTIDGDTLLINLDYAVDVDNTVSIHSIDYLSENPNYDGAYTMRYFTKDNVKLTYVQEFGSRR